MHTIWQERKRKNKPRSLSHTCGLVIFRMICSKTFALAIKHTDKSVSLRHPETIHWNNLAKEDENDTDASDHEIKCRNEYWSQQRIAVYGMLDMIEARYYRMCKKNQLVSQEPFKILEYYHRIGTKWIKYKRIWHCSLENDDIEKPVRYIGVNVLRVNDLAATAERRAQAWTELLSSHLHRLQVLRIMHEMFGHLFCCQRQMVEFNRFVEFLEDMLTVLCLYKKHNFRYLVLRMPLYLDFMNKRTAKKMIQYCGLSEVIYKIKYVTCDFESDI